MSLEGANIFVTGGLGYIGSHTVLQLLEHGARVTIVDNLSNSYIRAYEHMQRVAGDKASEMRFIECDIRDELGLRAVLAAEKFDACIHFAGFKAVGESVEQPLMYYENNVCGTIKLLKALNEFKCKNIVFSSSCTVYGMAKVVPITEDCPLSAISPYGRTKLFQEDIFRDLSVADKEWSVLLLRYFNPVGAHPSGEIGEQPMGQAPNNLMPYVQKVALGQLPYLGVFGGDYPTPDGTCVRDYIHIMDLADGHVAAVRKLLESRNQGCQAINLGTGRGTSVLEMVKAFEAATGQKVPYKIVDRRPGDTVAVWAGTKLAEDELQWKSKRNIEDMCRDQWAWASKYPSGFNYASKADAFNGSN